MSIYCTMCPGTEDTAVNQMDRSLPFQRQMSEAHVNHLSEPVITKRCGEEAEQAQRQYKVT